MLILSMEPLAVQCFEFITLLNYLVLGNFIGLQMKNKGIIAHSMACIFLTFDEGNFKNFIIPKENHE